MFFQGSHSYRVGTVFSHYHSAILKPLRITLRGKLFETLTFCTCNPPTPLFQFGDIGLIMAKMYVCKVTGIVANCRPFMVSK